MHKLTVWQDGKSREVLFSGVPLLSRILDEQGFSLPHPCGGRGRCGKCGVALKGEVSPPSEAEVQAGGRLSCQAILLGDCEASLPQIRKMEQIQLDGQDIPLTLRPMPGRFGAAVDIGTTTLGLKVFDLRAGLLAGSAAALNPQAAIAADVMGRIGAAMDGGLARLQKMILNALSGLLHDACRTAGINETEVENLVIAGNTAMLYLLTGQGTAPLSRAPFTADRLFDEWVTLLKREAYLPPCMHAFVGADISCAVLASCMCSKDETALLIDAGTNGEIALWKDGALLVCSTAAGPAFEGAGIHMGCGSIAGAVDSVTIGQDGTLSVHTIGGASAVGICGSGLIDALACLIKQGRVDETGAVEEEKLFLTPSVYLIPKDIRSTQLAKAAIAAGIKALLQFAGVVVSQVETLYLAGGFGSRLDVKNAAAIGLIPFELAGRVRVIGNAALTGAGMLLLDTENLKEIRRIARLSRHIALGGNPVFNEAYMEEMLFPATGNKAYL